MACGCSHGGVIKSHKKIKDGHTHNTFTLRNAFVKVQLQICWVTPTVYSWGMLQLKTNVK